MPDMINSLQNPRIKALVSLRRKGPGADDPRILIDGVREITRAAQAGLRVDELFVCQNLLDEGLSLDSLVEIAGKGVRLVEVTAPIFEKIRYGDRTGGLVAVAQRPRRTLGDLKLSPNPLLAVVENVGKPGNLGAILRSADGAGIEAVFVVDSAIDVYGPNVIRASVATVFSIPVFELSASDARTYLQEHGLNIVAANPAGPIDYTQLDFRRPTAFVFGAEDRGLSRHWTAPTVQAARVPMKGLGDSLNVSTTAALFFYEAVRQRAT